MAKLTKLLLAQKVEEHVGVSGVTAMHITEGFFAAITNALVQGDDVKLTGLGTLSVRQANARLGRNVSTGESVLIPAQKKVHFKPSLVLKKKLCNKTLTSV